MPDHFLTGVHRLSPPEQSNVPDFRGDSKARRKTHKITTRTWRMPLPRSVIAPEAAAGASRRQRFGCPVALVGHPPHRPRRRATAPPAREQPLGRSSNTRLRSGWRFQRIHGLPPNGHPPETGIPVRRVDRVRERSRIGNRSASAASIADAASLSPRAGDWAHDQPTV